MDLKGYTLVKITASWCKACNDVKNIETDLKLEFPNLKFLECSYDLNKNHITGKIPCFVLFEDGVKIEELQSSNPLEIFKMLSKNMIQF